MRTRGIALSVVAVIALTMTACDTTPPRFTTPLDIGFIVGGQIEPSDSDAEYESYTFNIPSRVSWGATDDDPDCAVLYDAEVFFSDLEPFPVMENDPRTHIDFNGTDYDNAFGGGAGWVSGYHVTAQDCANNTVRRTVFASPRVHQENGRTATPWLDDVTIGFSGPWATQIGPWTSGGEQRFTSTSGASVTFTMTFERGENIAVVMPRGPARGSARIYVDDVLRATVDTHADANDNRRIVFNRRLPAGVHTVRVENLATPGHPRIDIDAFMVV
jgi:hypothetical protein